MKVGQCSQCLATPAEVFSFRRIEAFVIFSKRYSTERELCRTCALSVGRTEQNGTLLSGWWGVLSFFRNIAAVWRNAAELRRADRMMPPRRDDAGPSTPRPLDPGRPVLLRPGGWIGLAGGVGAAVFLFPYLIHQGEPAASPWKAGVCVAGTGQVHPVSCEKPHTGKVLRAAPFPQACPPGTDSYVYDGTIDWCIQKDG